MKVEEAYQQASGLVRTLQPAVPRAPPSWGTGKVTGKFGALSESCASGEPSGGKAPKESAPSPLPGQVDPEKVSNAQPVLPEGAPPPVRPPRS